jgi:hypothetical protein
MQGTIGLPVRAPTTHQEPLLFELHQLLLVVAG